MLVLGIESSCDDTGAAIVEDGGKVLSSVVSSQDDIHGKYGGVVPELASRRHIEMIVPVVDEALERAGATLNDIGGIAVTQGPGLVGSILIGLSFAKTTSYVTGIPFTGVNHIVSHPHASFLYEAGEKEKPAPEFPLIALIVSGGHTTLLRMDDFTRYSILGQTLDDAAGEAFDKVAKLLGLGYPGGVAIDRLSKGVSGSIDFPRPYLGKGNLDFSFSGLKTAVLNYVRGLGPGSIDEALLKDMTASFQDAAVDVLVDKAFWAVKDAGDAKDLVVAGGVACNSRLRSRLEEAGREEGVRVTIPAPKYCSDNGAMIASLGFRQLEKGLYGSLDMNAKPTWEGF